MPYRPCWTARGGRVENGGMFRIIYLLKRKPGISHAEFRTHYETSHAQLAKDHIGHLMSGYTRHYVPQAFGSIVGADGEISFGPVAFDYDVIAHWEMPDEAAYAEIRRIMAQPHVHALFREDEKQFLDRGAIRMILPDTVDDGTGDGHLTLHAAAQ